MRNPKGLVLSVNAAKKGPFPLTQCARDTPRTGELIDCEIEKAYRKGYHQGATIALYAVKAGVPFQVVKRWADKTLKKWRVVGYPWIKGTYMEVVFPPDPPMDFETEARFLVGGE